MILAVENERFFCATACMIPFASKVNVAISGILFDKLHGTIVLRDAGSQSLGINYSNVSLKSI